MDARKLSKTERKVASKLARSLFAEHLFVGLTVKKNYGLCEATRHWHAAKNDAMEYSFIEFPEYNCKRGVSIETITNYIIDHDTHVARLENLLKELGTLHLSSDELDALAKQRKEN